MKRKHKEIFKIIDELIEFIYLIVIIVSSFALFVFHSILIYELDFNNKPSILLWIGTFFIVYNSVFMYAIFCMDCYKNEKKKCNHC